jgi:hypothetical protein
MLTLSPETTISFASFPPAVPRNTKGKYMVTKTLAERGPPTPEQIRKLTELAARPDCEIDFSDIPEITEIARAGFRRLATFTPRMNDPGAGRVYSGILRKELRSAPDSA